VFTVVGGFAVVATTAGCGAPGEAIATSEAGLVADRHGGRDTDDVYRFANGATVSIAKSSTQSFVPKFAELGRFDFSRACNRATPVPGSFFSLSLGTVPLDATTQKVGDASMQIMFDQGKLPIVGKTYTSATDASLTSEFATELLAFFVYDGQAGQGQQLTRLSVTFDQVPDAASGSYGYALRFDFETSTGATLRGAISGIALDNQGEIVVACDPAPGTGG
jgi:hypothetical protein